MKTYAKYVLTPLLGLLLLVPASFAQDDPPAAEPQAYTQPELDQILAPIALYPDPLLSQILMASTYPLEIVEAARWSRANPGFEGEEAVRMAEDRDWDPSVKSLVAFPKILAMMDEKLDWTQRLGNAYLSLPEQVTDTVQGLRQKADAAGNLKSNDHYRVEQQDGTVTIEPQNPEIVYVPYYDPLVVYGSWWWPAYPPVYWAPWPGYYAYPGFVGFRWGLGIFIGPQFFFGAFDWHHHHIRHVNTRPFYFRRGHHKRIRSHHVWKHNPRHRRGVAYRHPSTGHKITRGFTGSKDHGRFSRHRASTRGSDFASRRGSRFKSRLEQGKQPSQHSRRFESRPDNRRGSRRKASLKSAPNTDFKRDRRRMPVAHTESGGSKIKTSNVHRMAKTKATARRGEGRGNHARNSSKRGNFSARGGSRGVKSAPVSSFSSKKSFKSGSSKRGNFSARGGSRGMKNTPAASFSSKKSFKRGSSGGSRSFSGFRHRNGGGKANFRSR